jgi:V/A-type H+-transporting ATPase subunit K
MVKKQNLMKTLFVVAAMAVFVALAAPMAFADEGAEGAAAAASTGLSIGDGLRALGLALGAGIAMAGSALATGRAQASIGAGGTGALAEKPELFGNIFILVALPETIVVFGLVIAFMLLGQI